MAVALMAKGGKRTKATTLTSVLPPKKSEDCDEHSSGSDASALPAAVELVAGAPTKRLGSKSCAASKAKARKKAQLQCGRCASKHIDGEVPWVMVAGDDGNLVAAGSACARCWQSFVDCWKKLGWEWAQLCGKCKEDPDFNHK